MSRVKAVLAHPQMYIALQRIVGADRLRYRCFAELELSTGDRVVDVGCGPAYYLHHLPHPIRYHGFDTEPRYIEWAQKRWGERGTFHLGRFDEQQAAALQPVDAVLLLGVLHHLSDAEADHLLGLVARALSRSGQVVTVDTCVEPEQGKISRWMSDHDRGEHVREPEAFAELARKRFETVEGVVLSKLTRIPSSHWMMQMGRPHGTPAVTAQSDRPPPAAGR